MANRIWTRSPFYVVDSRTNSGSPLATAKLHLWISEGAVNTSGTADYQLLTKAIDGSVTFEISGMIRDFLDDNFSGTYSESDDNQRFASYAIEGVYEDATTNTTTVISYEAYDGYTYFTDGVQRDLNGVLTTPSVSKSVLRSTDTIYKPEGENISFGVNITQTATSVRVLSASGGSTTLLSGIVATDSDEIIRYLTSATSDVVKIVTYVGASLTETINVVDVCEHKYTPVRVTFVNKFGAMEDVWFFKASKEALTTKNEKYTANMIAVGTYATNRRQNVIYDKNGTQTITLNSGYYDESYNEVFKQLSLSESVWLKASDGQIQPININSSSLQYKTKLNDKLINYTIEAEYASSTINNVR